MTELILAGAVALLVGAAAGYAYRNAKGLRDRDGAEAEAKRIVDEAKSKAENAIRGVENEEKSRILEAKEKAAQVLEEAKAEERALREKIAKDEARIEKRESTLETEQAEVKAEREKLLSKAEEVRTIRTEVETLREQQKEKLQAIARIAPEQAKEMLMKQVEDESHAALADRMTKLENDSHDALEKRSMEIMSTVIQKYSRTHVADFTTSTVQLPNDDIKGKIIGKEGRNIRALEKETGVEFIIDETPETVIISGFDPVRREIAKMALEKLMADGRVHPASIEDSVAQAKKDLDKRIQEAGENAAYEAGIAGLHPKLIYVLGRLKYRYSYKQNVLLHSLEVSYLSAALAAELGANVNVAKKAGLFHDIGKAVDHEIEGTHVKIGMRILEKFGMGQDVIDGMKSHHDEYPHATIESYIVTAADALSAARPGARKETAEKYIKRLQELEALVNSYAEVEKSYAIQAGREIRIFVNHEKTDDYGAMNLAKTIANRIQEELQYPGEIRVIVFRETRAIEYAR